MGSGCEVGSEQRDEAVGSQEGQAGSDCERGGSSGACDVVARSVPQDGRCVRDGER